MSARLNAPIERLDEGSRYTAWSWLALVLIVLVLAAVALIIWSALARQPKKTPVASSAVPIEIFGYVKAVESADQGAYLSVDPAEWLTGQQANEQAKIEGACGTSTICYMPDGYYISNPATTTQTLVVSPEVTIKMQTLDHASSGDNFWDQPISLNQWLQLFAVSDIKKADQRDWKQTPFIFTVIRGKVTSIREQYVP